MPAPRTHAPKFCPPPGLHPAARVFSTGQVARMCLVAPRTVTKWFDSGLLSGYRIPGGKERRIPHAELVRFLRANGLPPLAGGEAGLRASVLLVGDVPALPLDPDALDVAAAEDGFAAGRAVAGRVPDVCVIDLSLGRGVALALARHLRSLDPAPALLALACEDEVDSAGLVLGGFSGVAFSPCDPAELAARVAGMAADAAP